MEENEKNQGKTEETPAAGVTQGESRRGSDSLKKQKRGIITAACVMVLIVAVWFIREPAISFISSIFEDDSSGPTSDFSDKVVSYSFYATDYDENIFEDEDYMDKNRMLAYVKDSNTFYLELDTEADYSSYDSTVNFFVAYLDAVINGEYESYADFFTDECKENYPDVIKERFTMQKLYDIKITFNSISSATDADGESVNVYYYYLDYKIYKNNGTFRNDIESDATRTLICELYVYSDGNMLINYLGRGDDIVSGSTSSSSCSSSLTAQSLAFVLLSCAAAVTVSVSIRSRKKA
ncbi:MAG: hypothetical protein LUH54_03345 [Firmicutes bacterium]|nr:hypothetical protein [Bacillota bacterium]